MANNNLTNAKRAKNDEFYTQYGDIQKKLKAIGQHLKIVLKMKEVRWSQIVTN